MEEDFTENQDEIEVIYLDDEEEILDEEDTFEDTELVDTEDNAILTFTKHSKSVFCGNLSRDAQFSVTGGEDDTAFLWSTSDGSVKFECTGHKDSVTAAAFNHDNKLLATGDMAGMIQIWSVDDQKLIWCYEGDDMQWLMWHPLTNVLIAGMQSGEVFFWQVPQGNCKALASHGSPCTSGKVLSDGKHILVGYDDGHLKLWDIKTTTTKWNFVDTIKSTITSIEVNADETLCSIAPSSHLVKMSDGKSIGTLLVKDETDIEAHVFSSEFNFLITGSLSGQICVWDLSKQAIRHQARLDCGITVLKLGLDGKVYIGSTAGPVYICDIKTGVLMETLKGHRANILSLCISCDGSLILTTSDDATAKVFCHQLKQS